MRTSVLLCVVAVVLLAGCVGSVADAPAGETTATSRTAVQTTPSATAEPTATPYPNRTASFPAGPKSEPERPAELTAETAAAFAKTYEYRYSYNDLSGPGRTVGMSEHSCHVESAEAAGSGYVVVVQCSAYVNEAAGGSESTATQHYDYPPWTARYYVDENSLLREEVEAGG